jgi:Endoribonuclease L-PSP
VEGFFGFREAPPPCFAWSPSPAKAGEDLRRRFLLLTLFAALSTPAHAGERQRATVLTGASWDDVVDITSFHTDIVVQMPAIVAAHKKRVEVPYPAWTAIDVDRLIPDGGITEIKIVAHRPKASKRRIGAS